MIRPEARAGSAFGDARSNRNGGCWPGSRKKLDVFGTTRNRGGGSSTSEEGFENTELEYGATKRELEKSVRMPCAQP